MNQERDCSKRERFWVLKIHDGQSMRFAILVARLIGREESFEISVEQVKTLELTAFDRNLVGKHDLIGSNTFKLDPRLFNDIQTRDVLLPLNPRGLVLLRITMEGGEKHDVAYHLSTASRALERAERDMIREMVEKMGEYIKSQLSVAKLHEMCRAGKGKKGKIGAGGVDEREVEASLNPLFDYLNENVSLATT